MIKTIDRFSVGALSELLIKKEISAVELTEYCFEKIASRNSEIGAFITLDEEGALAAAREADRKRASGESASGLLGIPFAVKDNLCVLGMRTTCGSRMLENYVSPYTATAVGRLIDSGAVVIGKTNMDEFGMGNATNTSALGLTRNPHDTRYTAGGSSGGSAAAVAARLVPFALGSDTGGSVRQPAAFCGAVGFKPSYGAVSRYGLLAYASSLDTVGVIGADVESCAAIYREMSGYDALDRTSKDYDKNSLPIDVSKLKIGVPYALLDGVSKDVNGAVNDLIDRARSLGASIVPVELPSLDACLAAYYVIASSEASSNLGRYDGVRYGYRPECYDSVEELFVKSRSEGFGEEVKRRILLGTYCLTGEARDGYYKRALAARKYITDKVSEIFSSVDFIFMPVSVDIAPKFELLDKKTPIERYLDDCYCVISNLSGIPSLSLPVGRGRGGMPVGVQIMADKGFDARLLALGCALERGSET
ncbi:MAG: Asp-tRNA(Asn)/Glu-tRNA(Gln) amidotransferase subunit GatA [Ruminococcaceae bacterium]|nr:Asp-tRNA(Asn)/Glu-tRNA(Gln) amidotransferase subunit GatA [Oscillospiraceae bacterium]